jgi:hypothetical protein
MDDDGVLYQLMSLTPSKGSSNAKDQEQEDKVKSTDSQEGLDFVIILVVDYS